jgi:hypothetical protein
MKLPIFYGTKGLLPHSQEPATGLCPELDESNPHFTTPFPQDPF